MAASPGTLTPAGLEPAWRDLHLHHLADAALLELGLLLLTSEFHEGLVAGLVGLDQSVFVALLEEHEIVARRLITAFAIVCGEQGIARCRVQAVNGR